MYLRLYAVWERRRPILIMLSFVLFCAAVSSYYVAARFSLAVSMLDVKIFSAVCFPEFPNSILWICDAVLIFCESLSVCLLLIKGAQFQHCRLRLTRLILSDGISYYIYVLTSSIITLVMLTRAPPGLRQLAPQLQTALHSIICTRLLLRLRGAYESIQSFGIPSVSESWRITKSRSEAY